MSQLDRYDKLIGASEVRQSRSRMFLEQLQRLPAGTERDTLIMQTQNKLRTIARHLEGLYNLRRLVAERSQNRLTRFA